MSIVPRLTEDKSQMVMGVGVSRLQMGMSGILLRKLIMLTNTARLIVLRMFLQLQ